MLIRSLRRINLSSYDHIGKNTQQYLYCQVQNPFQMKSLAELQKMLQMAQVQKSNPNFSYLILKAIVNKATATDNKRNRKQNLVKQNLLINQGILVALQNIKEADLSSIVYLSEVFKQFQDSRSIRIQDKNYRLFHQQFQKQIHYLLSLDSTKQHFEHLQQILFNLMKIRRKGTGVNRIIIFLENQVLKNNQQIVGFLQRFLHFNLHKIQFGSMEKIVKKYIENLGILGDNSELQSDKKEVHAVILQTVMDNALFLKPCINSHIKPYLSWLQKQIKEGDVELGVKIKIIKQIIDYLVLIPSINISNEEMLRHFQFLEFAINDILKRYEELNKFEIQHISTIVKIAERYQILKNNYLWAINQTLDSIQKAVGLLIDTIITKILSLQTCNSDLFIIINNDLVFSGIQINVETFKKLIQYSFQLFHSIQVNNDSLLQYIRLLEFVTFSKLEGKLEIEQHLIEGPFRMIQRNLKNLSYYEIIRLYAVMINLNIESKPIEDFIEHKMRSKEYQFVENLSRTVLKKYSLGVIKKICQRVIKQNENIDASLQNISICNLISVSLKSSKVALETETDEMFKFWFYDNWMFTSRIFRSQQNSEYYIKFNNKELLNYYSFRPIKSETQIQAIFNTLTLLSTVKIQMRKRYEELIRPLFRSSQLRDSFFISNRHSFFVKLAWLFHNQFLKIQFNKRQLRSLNIQKLKQLILITGSYKALSTSHCQPLKKMILWKMFLGYISIITEATITHFINGWFWANSHRVRRSSLFMNENPNIYTTSLALLRKSYPIQYCLEFYLAHNPSENLSFDLPDVLTQWKWRKFLDSEYQGEIQLDDQSIFTLLGFPNIFNHLIAKNPRLFQKMISRFVLVKSTVGFNRCIDTWQIYQAYSKTLPPSLAQSFQAWFNNQIDALQQFDTKMYSEAFLITKRFLRRDTPECVAKYISQNLQNGNYLAINEFTEVYQLIKYEDLKKFLQLIIINRSTLFLADAFQNQCVILVNSIFSLVILQNDEKLLAMLVDDYLPQIQNIKIWKVEQKNTFYLALCLELAFKLTGNTKLFALKSKIFQKLAISPQQLLHNLEQTQTDTIVSLGIDSIFKTFYYQKLPVSESSFLIQNNTYILLNDSRIHKTAVQVEYLKKVHHVSAVQSISLNQFLQRVKLTPPK